MYCSIEGGGAGEGWPPDAAETERLYYTDAYRRAFSARVVRIVPPRGDRPGGAVLDRTAFYPTSGGQPHDTGVLAGRPVVDVVDAGGEIVHVLGGAAPTGGPVAGAAVEGAIDWDRRFDHMQQHTAQHVLSAVFLRELGAETTSVHLGETSTLDLAITDLSPEDARRVEDAATRIVFENRPVTVSFVDTAAAAALGLRRLPRRAGPGRPGPGTLRVVEVADCDRSACGGTHVRSTAEIGLVLLRRWERTRGRVRVEFLAGWRAVRDYRWKHAFTSAWSARLSVGDRELADALDRLVRDAQQRERQLAEARRRLVGYEAAERLAGAAGAPKVVRVELRHRGVEEVRLLLREMTSRERCIVLAGLPDAGRLCFARSAGDGPEMSAVLGRACRAVGGRGGGTAEFAEGVVPAGDAVIQALALAEQEVRGA